MFMTVVIPVYKVEHTLNRCVESVLAGFEDADVLLIDDGSPDNCPQMCDEWAKKNSRVTAIHKANGGLSDARNVGIDNACGEYITFVDSDDFIGQGTYTALADILFKHPEYDVLEYPVTRYYGSERQSLLSFEDKVYDTPLDYWLKGEAYNHTYAWNKIYRRRLFNDVRFPVGRVFEDVYTLPQLLKRHPTVATTSAGMYYYVANPEGITGTMNDNLFTDIMEAHISVLDELTSKGVDEGLLDRYYLNVLNLQLIIAANPMLPMRRVRHLGGCNMKMVAKAMALNVLGVKGLCKLYKVMFH